MCCDIRWHNHAYVLGKKLVSCPPKNSSASLIYLLDDPMIIYDKQRVKS